MSENLFNPQEPVKIIPKDDLSTNNIMQDFEKFYNDAVEKDVRNRKSVENVYTIKGNIEKSITWNNEIGYVLQKIAKIEGEDVTGRNVSYENLKNIGYNTKNAFALQYYNKKYIEGCAILHIVGKNVYIIKGNCAVVILASNIFHFND